MRILIVEDEKDLNRVIVKKLTSEGYTIDSCYNGEEALDYIETAEYDAIIMDIMMPKKNGYEVVTQLRSVGNSTPILFLTAMDTIADKVKGLDIGANDYLVKPFVFDELMARIRVLTRKISNNQTNVYQLADLTVDISAHTVERNGIKINLSSKEYSVLEYMIRNKGKVLSREKIENNVWNFDYVGGTNAVDVYIRYLRKKIDENYSVKLIHTVRGSGYVLRVDEE